MAQSIYMYSIGRGKGSLSQPISCIYIIDKGKGSLSQPIYMYFINRGKGSLLVLRVCIIEESAEAKAHCWCHAYCHVCKSEAKAHRNTLKAQLLKWKRIIETFMVDEHEDDEEEDTEKSAEERQGWKEKRQPSIRTRKPKNRTRPDTENHDFRMGIRNSICDFLVGVRNRWSEYGIINY